MKTIPLYICDRDQMYLDRLNGFIQHQEHSPFLVGTYTEFDHMLEGTEDKELLLISKHMAMSQESKLQLWKHVVIMDENGKWLPGFEISSYHVVEKYQSARQLYEYLIKICDDEGLRKQDGLIERKTQCCITGLYTPEEKGLLHRFALEYAKMESEKGRCLMISFEECVSENKDARNLSDVICLIKEKDSDVMSKLNNYVIHTDNFDQILPPSCPYDLSEVNEEEWCGFLFDLMKSLAYTQIIIDFGNYLPEIEVLNLCSKIILPCSTETKKKCERFKELMIFMGKDLICKKTEIVLVKGDKLWNTMN